MLTSCRFDYPLWSFMATLAIPLSASAQGSSGEVPTRDQIPDKYKWNLADIYVSRGAWEADFALAEMMIDKLEKRKGTLAKSPAGLLGTLRLLDDAGGVVAKVYVYAHQQFHLDTGNSDALGLKNRSATLSVSMDKATSWIDPELLDMPEETLRSWTKSEPGLRVYEQHFDDVIRQKAHTLSAREEELLALAGDLAAAPGSAYTVLNNAELVWPTVHDDDGQEVTLSHARFNKFIRSTNRDVRREAFAAQMDVYRRFENTIAATLNGAVQRDIFFARARRFDSALEAALFPPNIPLPVYRNLVDTVNRRIAAQHRWAALRKRVLELDELHVYDLYGSLVEDVVEEIEYDDATRDVTNALAVLGDEYAGPMKQGFDSRWIDVYETKGKRSGGYAWGSYDTHPFILLNYNKTMTEVSTIAHEIGHAMHSYFTHKHQPRVYGSYKTFVAEVASITNEILFQDYLLKQTNDPKRKAYLLNHAIDRLQGTVFRQTMFAEFEQGIHQMAERGEPLTAKSMGDLYLDTFHKYWGPELVRDPQHSPYWARIPHFYRGFYVFQYATSYCAAAAVARDIIADKPGALDAYLTFLKAGSSEYPLELLRKAGVDMTSPAPIEAAMDRFEGLVGELERLLAH